VAATSIPFQRRIEVRHEVDVFVAGGGPAGMAAAVTAARRGLRVFLAEGRNCLGGMGTSGLLPMFCFFTDGVHFTAGGFGREIYDRLWAAQGMGPDERRDRPHGGVLFRPEALKRVYDDLVAACGIGLALETACVGVEPAGPGRLGHAVCWGKSGFFAVRAQVFVDGTGDGDLAAWAGAPFEKGDAEGLLMPGTLCSLWTDIDWEAAARSGQDPARELERAIRDGMFTVADAHLPGIFRTGRTTGGGNVGHTFGVDGTDEVSLTRALVGARKSLREYEAFYRARLKGFERAEVVATAAQLGIRESRRVTGDYVLTVDDFKRRAVFADEIGRFAYPVDVHAVRPDPELQRQFEDEFRTLRYGPGESYGIPYRTLTPRGLHNLLVAGRCISADRHMLGSVRVMPGCYITGQAAGMAAALAVKRRGDVRGVAVPELQHRLKEIGAYLPNA
jgi:hypothetical protein